MPLRTIFCVSLRASWLNENQIISIIWLLRNILVYLWERLGLMDIRLYVSMQSVCIQSTVRISRHTFLYSLRDLFFDHFWYGFGTSFFSDFGANLAPTCPPTWLQNRSKIEQKSNDLLTAFQIHFLQFVIDVWSILASKVE